MTTTNALHVYEDRPHPGKDFPPFVFARCVHCEQWAWALPTIFCPNVPKPPAAKVSFWTKLRWALAGEWPQIQ